MNRDNEGAIWKNDRREADTHPHFRGQATIDGVEYWVSAWKRDPDAKPNAPALKFSFRVKEQKRSSQASAPADDPDDDLPF